MTTDQRSPLWRVLILILSAIALGALVVAAACGGDDDDDDNGDNGDATATEPADDDDDDDTDAPTDEPDGDDDDDNGDDDPFADIEDLAGDYEGADGSVTYTFSADGEESTWTIYTEGDNSRFEFGDDSGSYISITTPEASYTCTESDGEGFCFEGEGGVGGNPFEGLFTGFASSDAILSYLNVFTDVDADSSSENIAGVEAECWTLSGDFGGDAGTIRWCFAPNGLLLVADYDLDSGTFAMTATDFSEDVPDGIFEPPYEVGDFGQ